jgi:methionyl-tRNA formyltransferase
MTLRVVFMGTPDFAVPTLEAIAARHEVVAVYSRAPALSGRGLKTRPSPVHAAAERLSVPVEIPARLRDAGAAATLAAYRPDVAVVVAYGLILPKPILDTPRLGCLNLHASLLPRWRGAAPIQRAVMAGDPETGVGIMRMEAGLDTGPVGASARLPIGPDLTAGELHDELSRRGAALMAQALDALEAGTLFFVPQPEAGVTYAAKITNEEARIDWSRPARAVHDHVRGLSPFPGAFFEADLGKGVERVKVLRTALADGTGEPGTLLADGSVACGEGALRLVQVQRAGRGPVDAADFFRGVRLEPGFRLG